MHVGRSSVRIFIRIFAYRNKDFLLLFNWEEAVFIGSTPSHIPSQTQAVSTQTPGHVGSMPHCGPKNLHACVGGAAEQPSSGGGSSSTLDKYIALFGGQWRRYAASGMSNGFVWSSEARRESWLLSPRSTSNYSLPSPRPCFEYILSWIPLFLTKVIVISSTLSRFLFGGGLWSFGLQNLLSLFVAHSKTSFALLLRSLYSALSAFFFQLLQKQLYQVLLMFCLNQEIHFLAGFQSSVEGRQPALSGLLYVQSLLNEVILSLSMLSQDGISSCNGVSSVIALIDW